MPYPVPKVVFPLSGTVRSATSMPLYWLRCVMMYASSLVCSPYQVKSLLELQRFIKMVLDLTLLLGRELWEDIRVFINLHACQTNTHHSHHVTGSMSRSKNECMNISGLYTTGDVGYRMACQRGQYILQKVIVSALHKVGPPLQHYIVLTALLSLILSATLCITGAWSSHGQAIRIPSAISRVQHHTTNWLTSDFKHFCCILPFPQLVFLWYILWSVFFV